MKTVINKVEFTLTIREGFLTLDRIFTTAENRGKGLVIPALKSLLHSLKGDRREIWVTVFPDVDNGENEGSTIDKEYAKLRYILSVCGFVADKEYRNDFIYNIR